MPISAEQWRVVTGSLNAGKGSLRSRPSFKPSPFCDLLHPPSSSDWKDYYTAMVLVCTPLLLYRLSLVCHCVAIMVSGPGAIETLISSPYSSTGLCADVGISFVTTHHNDLPRLLFASSSILLYVTMVIAVVCFGIKEHKWTRKKHDWVLTQQLEHLDLYLLNFGPEYEVIFDPETRNVYATLSMKDIHSEPVLKCVQMTNKERKTEKNVGHVIGVVVSFFLQLSPLVVLAMLLLLAGDVERNPGPVHGLDLATLTKKLSQAKDKWHEIGVQLGIPTSELSAIEDMYPTVDRRLSEMLVYWLDGNTITPICWESILEGLRAATVNKKGLAEKLKEQYCHQQDSTRKRLRPSSMSQSEFKEDSDKEAISLESTGELIGNENDCPSSKQATRYSFPYLNLGTNPMEAHSLEMKLCAEFDEMTEKFQTLKNSIKSSMEERGISVKKVVNCVSEFKTLEPIYTDLDQRRPTKFRHQFPELRKTTSLDEAMFIISDYCSFFNYSLVEQIIKALGTEEDKRKLVKYEEDFRKYAERSVYQCPIEEGFAKITDWPSFLVKVHQDGFEECSVNHLKHFVNKVAKILNIPVGMLLLESVIPGCIELTLRTPLEVYQSTFPLSSQQEQDLAALGVMKISAGDYQYPSTRDEGDDGDHDHKDDKPDDGPDDSDSGFGTLSTVLTERSDLKMPMDMTDRDIANPYEIDNYYDHDSEAQRQVDTKKHLKVGHKTPLHIAAYFGRIDVVRILVETNTFGPMEKDQLGNTALHCAVEGHHLDILKYFIETRLCDPSTMFTEFGETPLHLAARLGDLEIVKYLISDCGMDPMCGDEEDSNTPLHSACIGGNLEVIRYLVDKFKRYRLNNEFVHDKTIQGFVALHYAAFYGRTDTVKFFIEDLQCDPNIEGATGMKPIHCAAQDGHVATLKYLIHVVKCEPSQVDQNRSNAFHHAAAFGQLEAVKFLALNSDPCSRNKAENTPLHDAAGFGHLHVVKYLIEELKCDPNVLGKRGITPLHNAAQHGHVDVMKYLVIDKKCNPSQLSLEDSFTPLYSAAQQGQLKAIKFLTLDQRCNPSNINADGFTSLHTAASHGHLKVVKFFIKELNCDPNIQGKFGWTPLYCAAERGHVDIMKYLIDNEKCNPQQNNDRDLDTPLHIAASHGQLEAVKFLLDRGCDPSCRNTYSNTPLHFAAKDGHLSVVQFITELPGYDSSIPGEMGLTPLHFAAREGHVEIMEYLIDSAKCNPSQRSSVGITPLHTAAICGHLEAVKLLAVSHRCDPSCRDNFNLTPLHHAVQGGHVQVVNFLISEVKCDPNIRGTDGQTPLHFAALEGHVDIMKYLIASAKCNVSPQTDNSKDTPLHFAVANGKLEAVKFLTANGSDISCQNSDGNTPLHSAAANGKLEAVKILTANGSNISCRNSNSDTPLHIATLCGHLNIVKYFISSLKCNPNIYDKSGCTPLHCAAVKGHVNIMKYLIESAKCNPSLSSSQSGGNTPLHDAAINGQLEAIKFLTLEKGCDPSCRNKNGSTPLYLAAQHGHVTTVRFFVRKLKCDPNAPGRDGGFRPLHVAAENGRLDVVKYLIESTKCNPSQENDKKHTPLHLAALLGHLEVVKFLTSKKGCNPMVSDGLGRTPLHFAAGSGHLNIVKFYTEQLKCSPVAAIPPFGATPMLLAGLSGHRDIVEYLESVLLLQSGIHFYNVYLKYMHHTKRK